MIDVYVFKNNHFGKNITLLNLTPLNHIFAYTVILYTIDSIF